MGFYLFRTPRLFKRLFKDLRWEISGGEEKTIYLTFDDGPCPVATPVALEILNRFGVKATFFCVGENIKKHPKILKEVLDRGHSVGNHTYQHVSGWSQSTASYVREVDRCHRALSKYTDLGRKPLFRPPYGRITKQQRKTISNTHTIMMWSHLSGDFDKHLNIQDSLREMSKVEPGSVLVFHDNVKHMENMKKVLTEFVPLIQNKGFKFALLPNND